MFWNLLVATYLSVVDISMNYFIISNFVFYLQFVESYVKQGEDHLSFSAA